MISGKPCFRCQYVIVLARFCQHLSRFFFFLLPYRSDKLGVALAAGSPPSEKDSDQEQASIPIVEHKAKIQLEVSGGHRASLGGLGADPTWDDLRLGGPNNSRCAFLYCPSRSMFKILMMKHVLPWMLKGLELL